MLGQGNAHAFSFVEQPIGTPTSLKSLGVGQCHVTGPAFFNASEQMNSSFFFRPIQLQDAEMFLHDDTKKWLSALALALSLVSKPCFFINGLEMNIYGFCSLQKSSPIAHQVALALNVLNSNSLNC